ncbi:MAG: hypothetical protein ACYDAC_10005 [Candidatus Dormibacteria bacterium]
MRTTLNLDADVAQQLADLARASGRSVSRVANEVLRGGLLAHRQPVALTPYDPPDLDTGRPLLDATDIGETLERLDAL